MRGNSTTLSDLLDMALDLPVEAREAWLASLAVEHEALKPRLRALLARAAQVETSDFLGTLPKVDVGAQPVEQDSPRAVEAAGDRIGPYRLIREIGVGGMGSVWLADRHDGALKRTVALKFLRVQGPREALGERLARERDILAGLTHPGIARLYDAGISAEGLSYLVLEYIEGEQIDTYCREHGLGVRARLGLFLQVAQAVAYAHGKLVVHRDLKPANILVSANGVPHLLDFGIAKLLEGGRAVETLLTQAQGRALTPEYASPEQVMGEAITTASDVYSLGVVLYELLVGSRPYELKRNSRGALEEAILNVEPQPPSERVGSVALRRALRGDLDAITLKALKKAPGERYPTVSAFAEDIERHLSARPVLAQPDSAAYLLRRFVMRNRLAVAAGSVVLGAVLAGTAIALWQARVAIAERDRAEEVKQFIASIFDDADPYQQPGRALTGSELLLNAQAQIQERFQDRPELRAELLRLVGASLASLGDLPSAESALQQAVADATQRYGADHLETVRARSLLAEVHNARRDANRARLELAELLPLARAHAATDADPLVRVLMGHADLAFEEGRWDDIESPAREAFEVAQREFGWRHRTTIAASNLLAESFVVGWRPVEAMLRETERGLKLAQAAYEHHPAHPQLSHMQEVRGRALGSAGMYHEAIDEQSKGINGLLATFGPTSRAAATAMLTVAAWERRVGRVDHSLERSRAALAILEQHISRRSGDFAFGLTVHGVTLIAARRPAEALEALAEAERTLIDVFGATHWETLTARFNRAVALAYLGRHDEANSALEIAKDPSVQIVAPLWFAHVEGIVKRLAGDFDGAVAAQGRAQRLIEAGPRADWDRVRILGELGLAELERGNSTAARAALSACRDLSAALRIETHPAQAEVVAALGRAERALAGQGVPGSGTGALR